MPMNMRMHIDIDIDIDIVCPVLSRVCTHAADRS
jgi:hypothetical protein